MQLPINVAEPLGDSTVAVWDREFGKLMMPARPGRDFKAADFRKGCSAASALTFRDRIQTFFTRRSKSGPPPARAVKSRPSVAALVVLQRQPPRRLRQDHPHPIRRNMVSGV